MKLGIIAITAGGKELAATLAKALPEAKVLHGAGVSAKLTGNWQNYDGFICIMATGIVVRTIAPLLADKRTDPCVVVLDEKGRFVISLLAGHLGGGNELASRVAKITGGQAVITTASDTLGLVAIDLWAKAQGLKASREDMTRASTILVNNGSLKMYSEVSIAELPAGLVSVEEPQQADLIISNRSWSEKPLFHPQNLVVGVGCNRGTPVEEFNEALTELFTDLKLSSKAICNLASIDKKNDEVGLLAFAREHQWRIDFFSKDELNQVTDIETSQAALKAVGAIGVAEPSALLSAGTDILLARKRKWQNITMAVAKADFTLSARAQDR